MFATSWIRRGPALLGICVAAATSGCKTGGTSESAAVVQAETGTSEQTLSFAKADEQSLYLKMLAVELDAGAKVPKEQLHSSRGLFECRDAAGVATCVLRVRLPADELSGPQPVDAPMAAAVDGFANTARPELAREARRLVEVFCDYIGKKSPPYDIEEVKCRALRPRAVSEAVFDGVTAEALAELMRGKTVFGQETVSVSGAVTCRRIEGSGREACMVRAANNGVMQDAVQEVGAQHAAEVMHRLAQAATDRRKLTADAADAAKPDLLGEVSATLTCRVDSSRILSDGLRSCFCRAAL